MRAIVYLRLSQDRTGEGLGIERQREDCLQLIQQRGWSLVRHPFTDNDKSAAGRKPRPEFQAMIDTIRAGETDAVVAWALDRLARTARDRLALIEACQAAKTTIALVRGSDIDCTTPAGRLTAGVLGEVAQHEIDAKSDRQRRAMEQAASQGRWVGGRRPFAYEADGVTIRLDEAAAVRAAYSSLLAGVSLPAIAREWNSQGFTTGQAPWKHRHLGKRSPWRPDSVRRVLANARYAGIRVFRGEERGPAEWPPIVPEETYRAARAILDDPTRRTGGAGAAGRQLLTGLARCGVCDLTVHGGGASHGQPIYRCRSNKHINRLAAPVDAFIAEIAVRVLSRPDARDLVIDHNRPDVAALRDENNAFRVRLNDLAATFADGLITRAQLETGTARIRARLVEIEAQIADAGRVNILGDLLAAEVVEEAWDALSLDRQRAVIDILMDVRLHPVGRGTRIFRPETIEIAPRRPHAAPTPELSVET